MSSDVVILFGGSSSERLVSVASAQNVSTHLPDASCWFIAKDGPVFVTPHAELAAHRNAFTDDFLPKTAARWPSLDAALDSDDARGRTFFLSLHGGDGENGVTQRKLEGRGLAFTGSDSTASANAFDKHKTRELAAAKGARIAEARLLDTSNPELLTRSLHELMARSPRWVLKPRADGSSHGLVHLRATSEIPAAAARLHALRISYLAEQFVEGRELTVGVIDDVDGPAALPVSEVRLLDGGAFDYEGKYLGRGTEELTPAPIDDGQRAQAQALAVLTHRAVGCYGYSRTDMILTTSGPVLLEINTLPGMTKASFIPQQLAAANRDVKAFIHHQLELARARRDTSK